MQQIPKLPSVPSSDLPPLPQNIPAESAELSIGEMVVLSATAAVDKVFTHFEREGYQVEYGNILSTVIEQHRLIDQDYYGLGQVYLRKIDGHPLLDWQTVLPIANKIAAAKQIEIPEILRDGEIPKLEKYESEEEKIQDLKSKTAADGEQEYVDLYRGANNIEEIQLAGGLRASSNFKLASLEGLSPSTISSFIDYNPTELDRLIKLETTYPIPAVRAWHLQQSAMDTSPWVSTSSSMDVPYRFAPYVQHIRVPKSMVVDVEGLAGLVYRGEDGEEPDVKEDEVGVRGWINPDWIVKDEQVDQLPTIRDRKVGQISGQAGYNEGGFCTDEETGEQLYVKFYEDMDQGRSEVLANSIYRKLGIPAPESEVVIIDGKLAYVSKIVDGHRRLGSAELKAIPEVRNGFIVDAFLANWDVVGSENNNFEVGSDGKAYRIDNGNSMFFRSMGDRREYSEAVIELNSMRDSAINPSTAAVFEDLTMEEMTQQARYFAENLTDEDISNLVSASGLRGRIAETIIDTMKARRLFIMQVFGLI